MDRYKVNEAMELQDMLLGAAYPLLRKVNRRDDELLFKTAGGAYIHARKNPSGWAFDDEQKVYKEWYGTDIAIGGYIVETIPETINGIYEYLSESMPDDLVDEYFSNMARHNKRGGDPFPQEYNWIACYAVTGGSEGHYVHVDVITGDKRELLYLAKTFQGMGQALKIAAHLGKMLHV